MTALALHLWQSTLVLIAAWVLTRLCRRNSAEIRYWIWFCASLKFLVPFSLLQQLGDYLGRSLPAPLTLAPTILETGSAIFVPRSATSAASIIPYGRRSRGSLSRSGRSAPALCCCVGCRNGKRCARCWHRLLVCPWICRCRCALRPLA